MYRDIFENPDISFEREVMPDDLTLEQQVQWLEYENSKMWQKFNRLCNIVMDIQSTINFLLQNTDMRMSDIEYELRQHTNKFHAFLIISGKEDKKDESDIS
jgi:hypothetical protein